MAQIVAGILEGSGLLGARNKMARGESALVCGGLMARSVTAPRLEQPKPYSPPTPAVVADRVIGCSDPKGSGRKIPFPAAPVEIPATDMWEGGKKAYSAYNPPGNPHAAPALYSHPVGRGPSRNMAGGLAFPALIPASVHSMGYTADVPPLSKVSQGQDAMLSATVYHIGRLSNPDTAPNPGAL